MNHKKTIIITGCSTGIGAYCARQLKKDGWDVIATARQDADIQALKEDGICATYLDYREESSIVKLVDFANARWDGRIDALFNNGAYGQPGAVEDLPVEALRAQFEANLFGWHSLTQRVIPLMRAQNFGRIVQCSSILGVLPYKWRGAYNASKFALEGLSLTLAMELADSPIRVSLIEPGPIRSEFSANALSYVERHIDVENSVFKDEYRAQLARLKSGGGVNRFRLEPDAVYRVLDRALTARHPKLHYPVTVPAKLGFMLKRFLPSQALYRFLAKQS